MYIFAALLGTSPSVRVDALPGGPKATSFGL